MERILGIKFREYGQIYYFLSGGQPVAVGDRVIVETDQGQGIGEVVTLRDDLPEDAGEAEADLRPILRVASGEDLEQAAENEKLGDEARAFCNECIRGRDLEMKLVDVEVFFDRSKIIFYFTAPTRIDFRELVKDLVKNYRTRIELRQIGVRHETQMIGAVGNCGMVCCCRRFLRKFAPVTIKMAKEQNLFLNPAKISGICGRLLCCLSYEQENYEEFHRRCPRLGKKYLTSRGAVKVLRANMFRGSLALLTESNEEVEVTLEEWQQMEPRRPEQGGGGPAGGHGGNMPRPDGQHERRADGPEGQPREGRDGRRPERGDRPERGERGDRPERSDRADRPDRSDRSDRGERRDGRAPQAQPAPSAPHDAPRPAREAAPAGSIAQAAFAATFDTFMTGGPVPQAEGADAPVVVETGPAALTGDGAVSTPADAAAPITSVATVAPVTTAASAAGGESVVPAGVPAGSGEPYGGTAPQASGTGAAAPEAGSSQNQPGAAPAVQAPVVAPTVASAPAAIAMPRARGPLKNTDPSTLRSSRGRRKRKRRPSGPREGGEGGSGGGHDGGHGNE
ncbi:PSP1 domain-containing protein [Nitratidesulfovibrio termitidis]|uniref:PSP1 domain-containing protein n=1 Tax=Nitratidesulfovibrio termitidis TaxID=42252 RepID=UPI0003FDA336|nr:stage 0 sporulation family protein [Nitratidesulfovibrio termitidis]